MAVGSHCAAIKGLDFVRGDPIDIPCPGKIVVAEFWATWCPPCRSSIPHLSGLQHKYRTKGVTFVGITNEDRTAAERFVRLMANKMEYTVAVDAQLQAYAALMQRAGARGIPHAFIIDAEGVVRWSGHPMDPTFEPTLSKIASMHHAQQLQSEKQARAAPLKLHTREELSQMAIKDLKRLLQESNVESAGIIERDALVSRVIEVESERAASVQREE